MPKLWIYFSLLLWSFNYISADTENEESQKKKIEIAYPTMAPNSKFLNPHVDDDTNLQFAIAAFEEEPKNPEGKAKEVLRMVSESLASTRYAKDSRTSKSLDDWRLIPLLNSLIRGNKNYRFKNV